MDEARSGHQVDEVDLALLDALHINPRASFERLGGALDLSPVTVARRGQRLSAAGLAWVASAPGPNLALVAAVFEIEAGPGRSEEVGRALARVPQVISVYLTAGTFDVQTLVFAATMADLTDLVVDHLPAVAGVTRARAHVGTEWYSRVRWRLGAISERDERALQTGESGPDQAGRPDRSQPFSDADRALYLALQHDGRARYRDLARQLGTSEHLVRRRIGALGRQGLLSFRTDFVRGQGGWPTLLVLWLSVPVEQVDGAGTTMAAWPETRICMAVVGAANLFVMVQLHHLGAVAATLARIHADLPDAVVADQRLVLRPLKSWGRMLDHAGRSVGVVPVDPWAPVDFHQ